MKFKTLAAASLAVATMFGMGACGSMHWITNR